MFPVHFDEIETIEQIHDLSKEERIEYSRYVRKLQSEFDWNSYNHAKHNNSLDQFEGFKKFPPTPKDEPFRCRSWFEYFAFNTTCLNRLEYEPKSEKINYVVPKTYQPDASVNGVAIELKACPRQRDELIKHVLIREQHGIDTFWVIDKPNIILPWGKERKDGTFPTLENWLDANDFGWCTLDELNEVVKSDWFKRRYLS